MNMHPSPSAFQGAIELAHRGLRVFRLHPGTKAHFRDTDWVASATSDLLTIGDEYRGNFNFGAVTDGHVVIDVDAQKGGLAWPDLERLPRTFKVRTPSGGLHLYFKAPAGAEFSGSVEKLADGIDIRAHHNYVVAPGSTVNGRRYEVEDPAPIAPAPAWLTERLRAAPTKAPSAAAALCELDTPDAIRAATAYLRGAAPVAVEGSGGNATTYQVACQVRGRGVSPEAALDLLLQHWNERCDPPWEPEELEDIVAHAYRYAQTPPGRDNPALGFGPVVFPKSEAVPSRPMLFAPSASQWAGKKPGPIPFVIDRLVPEGLVTLLVSAGGRGKSTLAQQMMTCVAAGQPFLGFAAKRGAAAGVFCEDSSNTLHARQISICATLNLDLEAVADSLSPTSYLGADPVLWTERGGKTPFLDEIESSLRARPDIKLLVIDGSAYVFAANEIDRGQVTRFIAALTAMAQRLGIAIVLIHHESKSSADSDTHAASGSTAWINATRSVIKLNDDGGDLRTLKHIKSNLSRRVDPLPCTMASGGFALIHDNSARRKHVRDLTRELLSEALSQGVRLSDKPQAREQWAPRYLARQARGIGVAEVEYEAAIKALDDEFTFVTELVRSKPTRRCIRVAAARVPPDPEAASSATVPPD